MFILKGIEYEVKPLNIELKNQTLYHVCVLNKLITKFTFDIDMSKVRKYEKEIEELQQQLNQSVKCLNDFNVDPVNNKEKIEEYTGIVEKQTERLNKKTSEFEADTECKMLNKLYTDSMAYAMTAFTTDTALITDFLNKILNKKIDRLNFENDETKTFVMQVVNFFLSQFKMN